MRFRDRTDAGRRLAELLTSRQLHQPIVFALPRGGVPVAYEIAAALHAPLDVFVARKIGAPGHPEAAIGAISEGGGHSVNEHSLRWLGLSPAEFELLRERERAELDRRVVAYRGDRLAADVKGRDVVLVDDGLATGLTAEAALWALRARSPRSLLLAVPVCAAETAHRLRRVADEVIFVSAPAGFSAVSRWYDDFSQTSDAEVIALLALARDGEDEEPA